MACRRRCETDDLREQMNVLDLFSGIGGFSLGLERAGMRTVAFCEIDKFCKKVLGERWPEIPIWPGIYALNALLRKVRTSCALDFRVRTFHSLAKVPALPEPVLDSYGLSYEPFAWFDHEARCWRTWQRCLVEGWDKFSGVWPRSGMTRSGIAYRRAPLVPLTSGIVSGSLLPTPEATNTKSITLRSAGRSPRNFLAPLPTPRPCSGLRSSGANRTEILRALEKWPPPTVNGNHNRKGASSQSGDGLATAVRKSLATPTARDYRHPGRSRMERTGGTQGENLPQQVGGPLNPPWVEWLMGFPIGWTDCEASATPSSRKSRRSSDGQS